MGSGNMGFPLSIMAEELSNMSLGRASDLVFLFNLWIYICETEVIILKVYPRIKQNVQNIRHGSRHILSVIRQWLSIIASQFHLCFSVIVNMSGFQAIKKQ